MDFKSLQLSLIFFLLHAGLFAQQKYDHQTFHQTSSQFFKTSTVSIYLDKVNDPYLPSQRKLANQLIQAISSGKITPYWTNDLSLPMSEYEFFKLIEATGGNYTRHDLDSWGESWDDYFNNIWLQPKQKEAWLEKKCLTMDFAFEVQEKIIKISDDTENVEIISLTLLLQESTQLYGHKKAIASFSFEELNQKLLYYVPQQNWMALINKQASPIE